MGDEEQRGARIGVDVGGTFVDFVLQLPDGTTVTDKRLATPGDLAGGVLAGLEGLLARAAVAARAVEEIVHATTLGSNAVLERRGPPVALLTTEGFRDVLHIQRSLRWSMYDVQIEKIVPLVPRSLVFEVAERRLHDGSVHVPLDEERVAEVGAALRELGVRDVAVAFLHSYADPAHELRAREILLDADPGLRVTVSSGVSLQAREYERTNTAVVNAYLGPVLGAYLDTLERALPGIGLDAPLWIMQSSGGLASAAQAAALPVRTLESGPAAGVIACARFGGAAGHRDVISFDMGGTTAKAAVVRGGAPGVARRFELERRENRRGSGLPVDIPAIDLVEVGTGGGSIAEVRFGVLAVGPRSAGADPGPVCYGRGGTQPTVTDANLVLGYLDPEAFADGAFRLDADAARAAIAGLGAQLGLDATRAAWGIHEVATLDMERALRLVSIDQGLDPRDHAMVCIGGAGPAHGARLARALGIRTVLVPPGAGVGSAYGLLAARESVELAQTAVVRLDEDGVAARAAAIFGELEEQALELVAGRWDASTVARRRAVGLRHVGQGYELEIEVDGDPAGEALAEAFRGRYERTYGYREDELPVEAVTWFLTVMHEERTAPLAERRAGHEAQPRPRPAYFPGEGFVDVPVLDRDALAPGAVHAGPCLVQEAHTTTVVPPGDALEVSSDGTLLLTIGGTR